MNPFQNYFVDTFRFQYVDFVGRATRSEYWYFHLFFYGLLIASVLIPLLSILSIVFYVACLLPSLAVTVRRLHDTGNSGWLILIRIVPILGSLILLVFMCIESNPYTNQYGSDPLAEDSISASRNYDDIIDRW